MTGTENRAMGFWLGTGVLLAGAAAACLLRSRYERRTLSLEETWIASPKIKRDKTFVFLSDLHDNSFGTDNEELLEAIAQVNPEAVLIGGDLMVTKGVGDTRIALSLLRRLAARYPVYYGNGNHESRMKWEREIYGRTYEAYRNQLKRWGVHYLENDSALWDEDVAVSGLELSQRYYQKAFFRKPEPMDVRLIKARLGEADGKRFQILLAHSPLYFDTYAAWGADLTLAGHFHGGTIRLPLLGGVMTPQYQFFLPWCAGEFEKDGRRMLVSRGLGTHSVNIRLNNLPQLAVVHLKREQESHC